MGSRNLGSHRQPFRESVLVSPTRAAENARSRRRGVFPRWGKKNFALEVGRAPPLLSRAQSTLGSRARHIEAGAMICDFEVFL